jgi:hypothetical protein
MVRVKFNFKALALHEENLHAAQSPHDNLTRTGKAARPDL